jgi:ferric-dicitrate binding protein FerR (iron transport regulator)
MDKEYILHKWMNDEASIDEIEQLKSSSEYALYMEIAEASAQFEVPIIDIETNFNVINSKIKAKRKVRKLNPLYTVLKVAATLAIIFASYIYLENSNTTIRTQIAEKQSFLLPDDSEVALNANSVIEYNRKKWNDHRELTLDGEAYFKVSKGSTFKVNTPAGIVTVLGTEFNVYARDKAFYINCYEGLVSVTLKDTLIKLPAGDKLMIENGVLIMHSTGIPTTIPSWTINESTFSNTEIALVLEELKRQYSIKLTTKFNGTDHRFTGSFTHSDLSLALKSICNPLHLAYTIEEESVTIYAKEGP